MAQQGYSTSGGFYFNPETASELNGQIKTVAKEELQKLLQAKDRDAYFRQRNTTVLPAQLEYAYFALTCLWIKQKVGDQIKQFPVFHSIERNIGPAMQASLCLNGEFIDTYDSYKALELVYRLLEKKGLNLRVETDDFFLGFHSFSNINFSKRKYYLM